MCWAVKMATLFLFQGNAVSKLTAGGEIIYYELPYNLFTQPMRFSVLEWPQ